MSHGAGAAVAAEKERQRACERDVFGWAPIVLFSVVLLAAIVTHPSSSMGFVVSHEAVAEAEADLDRWTSPISPWETLDAIADWKDRRRRHGEPNLDAMIARREEAMAWTDLMTKKYASDRRFCRFLLAGMRYELISERDAFATWQQPAVVGGLTWMSEHAACGREEFAEQLSNYRAWHERSWLLRAADDVMATIGYGLVRLLVPETLQILQHTSPPVEETDCAVVRDPPSLAEWGHGGVEPVPYGRANLTINVTILVA